MKLKIRPETIVEGLYDNPDYESANGSTRGGTPFHIYNGNAWFELNNQLPVKSGERLIVKFDFKQTTETIPDFSLKLYNNGTLIKEFTTIEDSYWAEFIVDTNNIKFALSSSGVYGGEISNIHLISVNFFNVNLIKVDEIKITKIVKDFTNIIKTKSSYTTDILIQYDDNNIDVLGYFTENSNEDVMNLVNGTTAILYDDDQNRIFDGKIRIKKIIKTENGYILNLFFDGGEGTFFNGLSNERRIDLPDIIIPNTTSEKRESINKDADQHEIDKDFYYYGKILNKDSQQNNLAENKAPNSGFFHHGFYEFKTGGQGAKIINEATNEDVSWSQGYSSYLQDLDVIIRVKELFRDIHNRYGYTVHGSILDNPMFYNLSITPNKREYDIIDTNMVAAHKESTIFLNGSGPLNGQYQLDSFGNNILTIGLLLEETRLTKTKKYYTTQGVNEVNSDIDFNTDVGHVFGSADGTLANGYDDYDFVTLKPNPAFFGDNNVEFYDVSCRYIIAGKAHLSAISPLYYNFRVMVNDTLVDENAGDADRMDVTLNPYSFCIMKDYYIAPNKTGSYFFNPGYGTIRGSNIQEGFLIKNLRVDNYDAVENKSHYSIRHAILNEGANKHTLITTSQIMLTLRPGKYRTDRVHGNPYQMKNNLWIGTSEQKFIKDIITKFNLIPVVDSINKTVTYYTFDEFYLNDKTYHDWSDKIVRNKNIFIDYTPPSIYNSYTFSDNSGFDNSSKDFQNYNFGHVYGELKIDTKYKLDKGYEISTKIESPFMINNSYEKKYSYGSFLEGFYGNNLISIMDDYVYEIKSAALSTITSPLPNFNLSVDTSNGIASDEAIQNAIVRWYDYPDKTIDGPMTNCEKSGGKDLTKPVIGYFGFIEGSPINYNTTHEFTKPLDFGNKMALLDTTDTVFNGDLDLPALTHNIPSIIVGNELDCELLKSRSEEFYIFKKAKTNFNLIINSYDEFLPNIKSNYNESSYPINVIWSLYDYNYKTQIDALLDKSHSLEAYIILTPNEFDNLTMREKIIIDSNVYIIKKIEKYKPNQPTKIELLSFNLIPDKSMVKYSNNIDGETIFPMLFCSSHAAPTVVINDYYGTYYNSDITVSDFNVGFISSDFIVGETYNISFILIASVAGGQFLGYYTDGDDGGFTPMVTPIGTFTSQTEIEFEYTRTQYTNKPTAMLAQTFKLAGNREITYTIKSIKVIKI